MFGELELFKDAKECIFFKYRSLNMIKNLLKFSYVGVISKKT